MKVHNLNFDESSSGITRKSLLRLRNAIAENIKEKLFVVEMATDEITCGFFVFVYYNTGVVNVIWTGDGFRTDKGGEGGRGYSAAQEMLKFFRINSWNFYDKSAEKATEEWRRIHSTVDETERRKEILLLSQNILDEFIDGESDNLFQSIHQIYPHY